MDIDHLLVDGDTFFIDNSRLESFVTCEMAGKYAIAMKRVGHDDPALNFGGAMHAALELRYLLEESKAPSILTKRRQATLLSRWFARKPNPAEDYRSLHFALRAMRAYNDFYGDEEFSIYRYSSSDPASVVDTLAIEEPFSWPLGIVHLLSGRIVKVVWIGRVDLVVNWRSKMCIVDHKTTRLSPDYYYAVFGTSSALKGYTWVVEQKTGILPEYSIINALHCYKPGKTERARTFDFSRRAFSFDRETIDEWRLNTLHHVRAFLNCVELNRFRMQETQCMQKYGLCEYYPVCSITPGSRESTLFSNAYKDDDWSPLRKREVTVGEVLLLPESELLPLDSTPVSQEQPIDLAALVNLDI
jgi:hypothetical protein